MTEPEYLTPAGLYHIPGASTPVVLVPGADLVFLSGQVAWDEHGNLCGTDHVTQMQRIAQNLHTALAAVGCGREHIIKETVYVVDYHPGLIPGLFAALRPGVSAPPASTLVGVTALFAPSVLVEVEVVAKVAA
ncbi:RidA family protein [Kibdelosporangium phytohabitans]|uniref:Endoribonuclease n=1 Tax=Kibdelosporangium phytohabitans TaxID=860235 RepID=A0A0N7F441_9PSEU|nr:RidA family protein [Kibdelosporangium phytohabitans]ALG10375.1 endoribonuclease [Kibdelosporangium phytohabitans]MBE1461425.1 enamine deaminase RidA (YjgF/YER057c/UK114 family) [Kibdelosporangium phytohabitans]